jgi:PKD repeat protein
MVSATIILLLRSLKKNKTEYMKKQIYALSTPRAFARHFVILSLFLFAASVKVLAVCDAHFAHYSINNPDSLHFYPSTTGAVSYSWSFGDGSNSTSMYPWHGYAGPGTYNVCLTVVDSDGSTCYWCDTVNIAAHTTCNAAFSHYYINNPDSLHFYPNGTTATAYYWNFGDGTTSTQQYPWHYYNQAGTYYVCLTVADTSGVTCTSCDTVTVGHPSTCNAAFNHYTIHNPDSLHFYPTGTGGMTWYWNFGDGTTSSQEYPWHFYTSSGTYYVCLTVVDSAGSTCTSCANVVVGSQPACNAAFSHYALGTSDSLHFYATGGGITSYYWNFGDGTTSTQSIPWHYFTGAGTYYVCLTVVDTSGATCTSCDTVTVGHTTTCIASFGHYVIGGHDSIRYYPTGTVGISYYWSFGDGTYSTQQYVIHSYSSSGTYNVCLTVVDTAGGTCTQCDTVTVGASTVCNASFAHYPWGNSDSTHFYPLGTSISSYSWNFGDGTTSTASAPFHVFTSPGTYYVCLSVVTTSGATCSSCDTVHIGSVTSCNAQFSYYTIHNPDSLHFYPTGTGASSYYWSFGDGSTSTSQYPWHYYIHSGTYYVCLTVADSAGATCTWCDSVHVNVTNNSCNATFVHYNIGNPDSVHFYPTGPVQTSYYWTFGDGGTSTTFNPWHYYSSPGTYYACLTVADTNGASCTTCDTVTVAASTTCNASFSHYTIHNPDSLHFYPTGTPMTSWYWSFGDGTVSHDQYPWHYYSHAGTYYVCLTVADSAGVTCTSCDTVTVGSTSNCSAAFSHYTINNPDSLHFYPTGTGGEYYYWNFGDGSTSTSQYPWHFYAGNGTYYVCLTVADSSGVTCTSCDTVYVGPANTCNAQFSDYAGSNADSIHFYPASTANASYYWDFGDGSNSTNMDPWHQYSSHGTYYVCLTVVDAAGATCTSCDTVHVGRSNFHVDINHNSANNPDSIQFFPTGSAAVAYYWNFGDGGYSSEYSPWHFYATPGTYTVTLTAADSSGLVSVSTQNINTSAAAISTVQNGGFSIKVYPNPANDIATITLNNVTTPLTFKMYDVTGRLIEAKAGLVDGSFNISTREFSQGLYYYMLSDDTHVVSQGKLMVAH